MKKFFIVYLLLLFFLLFTNKIYAYGFGVKKGCNIVVPDVGFYKDIIEKNGGFYVGDTTKKDIYLTFDCGYENGYTEGILDILRKKRITALFFITGHYIDSASDIVLRMKNEGHVIGNHSNKHKDITTLSEFEIKKEIDDLNDKYFKLTNEQMSIFFRPPAGKFDERSLSIINKYGYVPLFWSMAYKDWINGEGDSSVVQNFKNEIHNGAIILLHAVSKNNLCNLEKIIDTLENEGYQFRNPYNLLIGDNTYLTNS